MTLRKSWYLVVSLTIFPPKHIRAGCVRFTIMLQKQMTYSTLQFHCTRYELTDVSTAINVKLSVKWSIHMQCFSYRREAENNSFSLWYWVKIGIKSFWRILAAPSCIRIVLVWASSLCKYRIKHLTVSKNIIL